MKTLSAALVLLLTVFATPPAFAAGADTSNDDAIRLNPAITVTGDVVHLGDIFQGYLARPEKVVAQAPQPGQRLILSSEWLTTVAQTYGLDWRPMAVYDRAIVYRPGRTVTAEAILAAIKSALTAKGMPNDYGIMPGAALGSVTIAAALPEGIEVREAFFDSASKTFSAVVEIPPNSPQAQFLPVQGQAYPVVHVPVPRENVPRNTVITADMLTTFDMREGQVKSTVLTDASAIVGKAPKIFLKAGVPVREDEIAQISVALVPVLAVDLNHETAIAKGNVTMASFNTAELPRDVILNTDQLVGKTPRHFLAAGAPIRNTDVEIVRKIQVPVLGRDMSDGVKLTAADIAWVTMNDAEVPGNVLLNTAQIIGRMTKHGMRTGQIMHAYDIVRPTVVEQGKMVTIIYATPLLNLSVEGLAQETGGLGDLIKVANTKSNTVVLAEVIDTHTVRVTNRLSASAN